MTNPRQALGRFGEDLAARRLAEEGWAVIQRNYRCRAGEMDIVAQDDDCLVFVEVRTRRSRTHGTPEESVNLAKQRRLVQIALSYLDEHAFYEANWRIDVVAIQVAWDGSVSRYNRIESAVAEDAL
jgi:putative endonuclease